MLHPWALFCKTTIFINAPPSFVNDHFSQNWCTPAAAVRFEQEQYAVNESENVVEVCVITEGFGVAFNLSTISLTAQGICEFIV